MKQAVAAGLLYFLLVFAAGFLLGTLRIFVLLPRVSEIVAVLLEMPLILAACWILAGALVRHLAVPPAVVPRLVMGALALALLLLAEAALSLLAFGRSWPEHLAHYATWPGGLGLSGQVLFGAMPLLRLRLPGGTA